MIQRSLLPVRQYLLDRMVLRPTRHPIQHPHQQREVIEYHGRALEWFVQRNFAAEQSPELLILKFPGTAGRAERATSFPMSLLPGHRVEICTWNPPGYGRSEGRASLRGIAEASLAFWEGVTRRYELAEMTTWLCGNSLGCVTALHVAASVEPESTRTGLILRNPPPLIPVVKRITRRYPLGGLMEPVVDSLYEPMNAMQSAARVRLPAVFLQSELDSLVPQEDQNRLIAAYGGPSKVVVLHGLEHGCAATDEHFPDIVASIDWLRNQTAACQHVTQS